MNNIFYPKQINKTKIVACENQCFFAMPFSSEYTNLYDTLVLYLENDGYNCVRVDNNLSASVPIINLILNGIASSQYIIVDVSESNANVFYELGITHTVKDFENVFIIKEKSAKTPFDIQHLQYIEYDKNNLKNLANELLKRLQANQYKNAFRKILSAKQILKYDDIDDFVDYFSSLFDEAQIVIYTGLLENTANLGVTQKAVLEAIWEYDNALRKEVKEVRAETYIPILFKLFFEILLPCCRIDEVRKYIDELLNCKKYSGLSEASFLAFKTDLAIRFAENLKLNELTLKWIIEYFKRSKSTKVDLNRYKLEAFLLKTDLSKVNEYIANAILSENNYIREHMADIAGEKELYLAEDNLITQLKRETNIYTTASIAEALGKIKSRKSLSVIRDWLDRNSKEIIDNNNLFVLKHFRNALIKIDPNNELKEFDKKYFELLLKNNTI